MQLKTSVRVLVNRQEVVNGYSQKKFICIHIISSTDNLFPCLELFEFMDTEVNRKFAGMTRKSFEESGVW